METHEERTLETVIEEIERASQWISRLQLLHFQRRYYGGYGQAKEELERLIQEAQTLITGKEHLYPDLAEFIKEYKRVSSE